MKLLPGGIQYGVTGLFHTAEGAEINEDKDENQHPVQEKAYMLAFSGSTVHNHAGAQHNSNCDKYGHSVFFGEIASPQFHGDEARYPVVCGGSPDLRPGLGKKIPCNDKELLNMKRQRKQGDKKDQRKEQLLQYGDTDKKLSFFQFINRLHGKELKQGSQASHGCDNTDGRIRNMYGQH